MTRQLGVRFGTRPRKGFNLLELLIVIGIVAVLLSLLLSAVVKVRESANRASSTNNLRQIMVAVHHFADTHDNRLPTVDGHKGSANRGDSLFEAILPYIEQGAVSNYINDHPGDGPPPVKTFMSPADPTIPGDMKVQVSSYAANAQVFQGSPSLTHTFLDGTSTTIAIGEHYSWDCNRVFFLYTVSELFGFQVRRATFADGGPVMNYANYGDVFPVTRGNPPSSDGDMATPENSATFQVAPTPPHQDCKAAIPQTPHRSGMLAAMSDGSVRTLSPGMAPTTFWGAVTPAGGEVMGPDW